LTEWDLQGTNGIQETFCLKGTMPFVFPDHGHINDSINRYSYIDYRLLLLEI